MQQFSNFGYLNIRNIRLINTLGEVVFNTKTQGNNAHLSLPNLSKGVYLLEVNDGNQRTIRKIIKTGL